MVPEKRLEVPKTKRKGGPVTVTKGRIALLDVLRKAGLEGDVGFLKQAAQMVANQLPV